MAQPKRSKSENLSMTNKNTQFTPVFDFAEEADGGMNNALSYSAWEEDGSTTDDVLDLRIRSGLGEKRNDDIGNIISAASGTEAAHIHVTPASSKNILEDKDKEPCCSEDLAGMNTNSNGKVSTDIPFDTLGGADGESALKTKDSGSNGSTNNSEGKGTITARHRAVPDAAGVACKGRRCLTRVKSINMGEIPLQPVGLSLSGSGMELYVKVDNVLHKEQLANLESQIVAQVSALRRPIRKPSKKKRERQPTRSQCEQSPAHPPQNIPEVCVDSDNEDVFVKPINPPSISRKCSSKNGEAFSKKTTVCDNLTNTEPESSIVPKKTRQTELPVNKEVPGENWVDASVVTSNDDACSTYSLKTDSAIASLPAVSDSHTKDLTTSQHPMNSLARCTNGTSGSQSLWHRPVPRGVQQVEDAGKDRKKRPMPPVFTSSDLPLKRPSALASCSSSGDVLVRQQQNNSGYFSPVPLVRSGASHAFCSTNNASVSSSSIHRDGAEDGHSAEQEMSIDDIKRGESSTSTLANIDSSDTHSLPLSNQELPHTSVVDGTTVGSANSSHLEQRMEDNMTPLSFADFNPSQLLASGTVDAVTLARFAQYTRSMRRDLKQNYKKLSTLMKEFNDDVMEHYREQTDTAAAAGTSGDNEADGDQDGRPRGCLIM